MKEIQVGCMYSTDILNVVPLSGLNVLNVTSINKQDIWCQLSYLLIGNAVFVEFGLAISLESEFPNYVQ